MNIRRAIALFGSTLLALISFSLFVPALAFAASTTTASTTPLVCSYVNPGVTATILRGPTAVTAGTGITVSGTVTNVNNYPLTDVSFIVRVTKLAKNKGSIYDTATDTVDRVVPVDHLSVPAHSSQNFSFTWHAASDLVSGPYRADIYLVSNGQFAVGGNEPLDIPLASYPIVVTSKSSGAAFFDTTSIAVNGIAYHSGSAAKIGTSGLATTSVSIENTGAKATTTITWYVYDSKFIDDRSLVSTSSETVVVPASGKATAAFATGGLDDSLYTIVGELSTGNKNSFVFIHLSRPDVVVPVARLITLNAFPVNTSDAGLIAGCFSEASSSAYPTLNANITLTAGDGSTVFSNTSLIKTSSLFTIKLPFTASASSGNNLTLSLVFSDLNGVIVSSTTIPYVCTGTFCGASSGNILSIGLYIGVVIVLLAILIIVVALIRRRK